MKGVELSGFFSFLSISFDTSFSHSYTVVPNGL